VELIGLLAVGAGLQVTQNLVNAVGCEFFIEVAMQFIQCLLTIGHVL
jgi:hypothetical protein